MKNMKEELISKGGLQELVLVGGWIGVVVGSPYIKEVKDRGFYKTNHKIYEAAQEELAKWPEWGFEWVN